MTKEQILLGIGLLNTLAALLYLMIMEKKKQRTKGLLIGVILLIAPVYGICFMLVSYLFFCGLKYTKTASIHPEELSFRKEKIKILEGDSLQRGLNKVPIEEALLTSDSENTRKVLLDVLKADFESSIPILAKAIESEDTEVAHYASAAISDVLSKFKRKQKELDELYCSHSEDEALLTAYRNYLFEYLSYRIFPETEENYYLKRYGELMEAAFAHLKETLEAEDYENWIYLLLEYEKEAEAKKWLSRLKEAFPESLSAYKAELEYLYRFDRQNFGAGLEKIKASPIMLDETALEWMRFFVS